MTNIEKAYKQGFIDGLVCFAHWKDGTEYIGTCGTTLKSAIAVAETQWNYRTLENLIKTIGGDS